jgi:hypothetical protein
MRQAEPVSISRGRFLAMVGLSAGATLISRRPLHAEDIAGPADVPSSGSTPSFGPLKQVEAGLLNVGYAEAGPTDGPVVILLHGWPYDIHTYVNVAPLLASKAIG